MLFFGIWCYFCPQIKEKIGGGEDWEAGKVLERTGTPQIATHLTSGQVN